MHTIFIVRLFTRARTDTHTDTARSSSRRACCPLARSSDDGNRVKIPHETLSVLGVSPAGSRETGSERARWGARALTCTGRGGSRRRTRGLLLLLLCLPRASAAPGLAAPLSAPAAASAPRRRPPVRSSGPRRRRRPPPRCGWRPDHSRTRRGHSTRSPPHPAANVKVASDCRGRSRHLAQW
eukprot:COSAG03_NODE_632_length_6618_cov_41.348366_3_plen_182_part_00